MAAPENTFKTRLLAGETLYGCWLGLGDAYAAEVMGTAGFDWLVIDGEHAPNDIRSLRDQLMALEASESHPVVRLPIGATWMLKQVLDIGAQTVLVPMVESAEQAKDLVRAVRYPPEGVRGVGASLGRATRFASVPDYVETADAQICLLVQVESRAGVAALDGILQVDGVDGVFIGPADLAADMGHGGDSGAEEVQETIRDALGRIAAAGKAPGILSVQRDVAERYRDWGARFLAVGVDVLMLAGQARAEAASWRQE
ncbi:HpcH/HpaI aldolase/citrate lyase family protein [Thalassococcus sp. S3]|uniref:HpcH/HpaI aldolase family protein n=1 Tax=Thalassococcus sp. S3 TaxID=2017482 RepID=UPI0010240CED|nr:HpcH/HpaI aldolase/citrate lyase family protein [Thalassococcus sp. S3]QBF29912.1 2-keto-3-deoxy-L-rhamnonate aldolase [Thalassococcus sp. S3]